MLAEVINPRHQEVESDGSVSSRPASSTQWNLSLQFFLRGLSLCSASLPRTHYVLFGKQERDQQNLIEHLD